MERELRGLTILYHILGRIWIVILYCLASVAVVCIWMCYPVWSLVRFIITGYDNGLDVMFETIEGIFDRIDWKLYMINNIKIYKDEKGNIQRRVR